MTAESTRSTGQGPKPVVTLFEQYGSGADAIGRAVAEAIGLPYHAQAFSSEELEGGPAQSREDALDDQATLAEVFTAMGGAYGGFDGREVVATQREKRDLVRDNNATVRGFADEGGVIVGRNATMILADRSNTVHVLLTGNLKDRVARGAEASGVSEDQAGRRQRREDQVRADMSRILYGWDPLEPHHYDLVINTSRIPAASAVAAIVDTIRAATA